MNAAVRISHPLYRIVPATQTGNLWVVGFLMTGLSLLAIGLMLGTIGRVAESAGSYPFPAEDS